MSQDLIKRLEAATIEELLLFIKQQMRWWYVTGWEQSPLHGLWDCGLYSIEGRGAFHITEKDTAIDALRSAILKAKEAQDASPLAPEGGRG